MSPAAAVDPASMKTPDFWLAGALRQSTMLMLTVRLQAAKEMTPPALCSLQFAQTWTSNEWTLSVCGEPLGYSVDPHSSTTGRAAAIFVV